MQIDAMALEFIPKHLIHEKSKDYEFKIPDSKLSFSDTITKATLFSKADFSPSNPVFSSLESSKAETSSLLLDTSTRSKSVSPEEYFEMNFKEWQNSDVPPPLLTPTQNNIDVLSHYVSDKMNTLLAESNVPEAPEYYSFDQRGEWILPPNYKYKAEFTAAMHTDKRLNREAQTLHALMSIQRETQKSLAFQEEYSSATTQEDIDRVLFKYKTLFAKREHEEVRVFLLPKVA